MKVLNRNVVLQLTLSAAAMTVLMLVMDLWWLGVFMESYYREHLGSLRAASVFMPAAAMFYFLYLSLLLSIVGRSETVAQATRWGGYAGFYAYGVYELTNWAVIAGWPNMLVVPDWLWGIVLTSTVAAAGKFVYIRTAVFVEPSQNIETADG